MKDLIFYHKWKRVKAEIIFKRLNDILLVHLCGTVIQID